MLDRAGRVHLPHQNPQDLGFNGMGVAPAGRARGGHVTPALGAWWAVTAVSRAQGTSKRSPHCSSSLNQGPGSVETAEQVVQREEAGGEHSATAGLEGLRGALRTNTTKSSISFRKARQGPHLRKVIWGSVLTDVAVFSRCPQADT